MPQILVALLVFAGCVLLLLGWHLERPPGASSQASRGGKQARDSRPSRR